MKSDAHVVPPRSSSNVDQHSRELTTRESEGGVGNPESVSRGKERDGN